VTRDELILRTRQLIAEGERLDADPSMISLQTWLQLSDDLLATAWGTMDRYHLAWLMVGKPKAIVRGRALTADEEAAYVREVATAKTAALRMSLDAVERQRMPFRGETGGIGAGQGMGQMPNARTAGAEADAAAGAEADADAAAGAEAAADAGQADAADAAGSRPPTSRPASPRPEPSRNRQIPLDPELAARLDEVRRAAAEHADHADHAPAAPTTPGQRRAPRPDRLQH
jgi:hypothetical protein